METDFLGVPHDYFETTDGDHGRVEIRRHWTIDKFGDFPGKAAWKDLRTMGMVESERHIKGEVTTDRRYYIASLTANAEQFASCVRGPLGRGKRATLVFGRQFPRRRLPCSKRICFGEFRNHPTHCLESTQKKQVIQRWVEG